MPLIKRSSKAARAVNVRRLIDEGYPPRQAVAIAYSTQRAAAAHNRAGFSGEPYTVRTVGGGSLLYVSRIGNRAAAYSPHSGFTVFGAMDGGELRVSYGKKGKHYSTPKTAEAAIRRWILEERREGANRAGRRSAADRLFIGVFPGGISYADRGRSEHGDYARVAFLPYDTLELKVSHGADPKLVKLASEHAKTIAAKRGQPFSISTAGQTVMLGSNRVGGKRRNRAGKVRPKDEADARKIARDALQKAEKAIRSLRFDPESGLIAQEDRAVAAFNRLRDRATDAAPYLPRDENDAITDALRNLRAMLDESIANASTVAKQAQSKIYAAADREASIERLARAFQREGHSLADARKIARFRHENRAGGKRPVFAVVYAPATASRGPLYWSPEPGSYARRATGAWKTHDRAAAERFADQYGGTVVELPSRRR